MRRLPAFLAALLAASAWMGLWGTHAAQRADVASVTPYQAVCGLPASTGQVPLHDSGDCCCAPAAPVHGGWQSSFAAVAGESPPPLALFIAHRERTAHEPRAPPFLA